MKFRVILFIAATIVILVPLTIFIISITRRNLPRPPRTAPTPAAQKIDIVGIKTNNFLQNPVAKTPQGDALITRTDIYQITYLKKFNEFIISIKTTTAADRVSAENAFLEKLGIKQEEACMLKVSVNTPYVAGQEASKGLSFCL